MGELGQLVVYLINKDKLSDFKTTRSFYVTADKVYDTISLLKLQGELIQNAYYNNKKLKV